MVTMELRDIYSFGNKPMYGISNGSSIGIYCTKKSKNPTSQEQIHRNANQLESDCAAVIHKGMLQLSRVIPGIKYLLAPIINAAYNKQSTMGCELLKSRETSLDGF